MSKDHLAVSSEKIIYQAVLNWIDNDPSRRMQFIEKVMTHVRFALMETRELREIAHDELIRENPFCRDLVDQAIELTRRLAKPDDSSDVVSLKVRPRVPLGLPKVSEVKSSHLHCQLDSWTTLSSAII